MIRLRNLAAAFIFNGHDVLMMKVSPSKKLFPGMWAPVGGHIEPDEINDPQKACLREVLEETGLEENDLGNIRLKYITHRQKDDEIRIQYVFFMDASKREFVNSDEGELFWIDKNELSNLDTSFVTKSIIRHYLEKGGNGNGLTVGTVSVAGKEPLIQWSSISSLGYENGAQQQK